MGSVRIAITANDQSAPAIAEAQARILAFKAAAESAGTGAARSFGEARAAAKLFSEELGVGLNRHLAGVLAQSQLLGGVLAAAFPIAAAIGFIEVAEKVPSAIRKIADEMAGFGEGAKSMLEAVIAKNDELLTHFKTTAQGYTAIGELNQRIAADEARVSQAAAIKDTGVFSVGILPWFQAMHEQNSAMEALTKDHKLLEAASTHQADLTTAGFTKQAEAAKKFEHEIEAVQKRLQSLQVKAWDQAVRAPTSGAQNPGDFLGLVNDLQLQRPNWLAPAADDSNLKARQGWFDSTRTSTERLDAAVKQLNADFAGAQGADIDTYARALQALKETTSVVAPELRKMGDAFTHALAEGALLGRRWSDVLKSLLPEIAELVAKMTILKSLNESNWASSLFGGMLFGSGGMFSGARAGGGPVSAGSAYLVGESGPEAFIPSSSGTIVPNSKLGGTVINYTNCFTGADAGSEMRIRQAIRESEDRAVNRSVAVNRELGLRR